MADNARALTQGEQHLGREIFGSAINYAAVKIHNGRYIFFQPSDTAMTPNGEIYFPQAVYKDEFSTNLSDSQWLIHELTHVWQYQHGTNVAARAIFNRTYDYGRLDGSRSFADFGVEQQAAITADYRLKFRVDFRGNWIIRRSNSCCWPNSALLADEPSDGWEIRGRAQH